MLTPELTKTLARILGTDVSELRRRLSKDTAAAWLDTEMQPGNTLTPFIGVPQRGTYYIDDTQAIWTVDDIERASAEETELHRIMRREHAKARKQVPDEQYACLEIWAEGDDLEELDHRPANAPWRTDPWNHDIEAHFAVYRYNSGAVNKIVARDSSYEPYPWELEDPDTFDIPVRHERRHFEGPGHHDWSKH
jgi:hypothetical protein